MTEVMLSPSPDVDDEEALEQDEEGLALEYDVILCGTGLIQAILASALARAGKRVLHCDASEHYGELDAVWTLEQLQLEQSKQKKLGAIAKADDASFAIPLVSPMSSLQFHSVTPPGIVVGTRVQTRNGVGHVTALRKDPDWSSVAIEYGPCKCMAYYGVESSAIVEDPMKLQAYLSKYHGVTLLLDQRQFQQRTLWDVSPMLVLANGPAVEGMLHSNVAEYLEFQSMQSLLWYQDGILSKAPCSKTDVFSSKLLSPMDKRRLMKLLQLVMDYAQAAIAKEELENEEEDADEEGHVQSWNERHLNQGRSLARPQNKAIPTADWQQLQDCLHSDMTLDQYLQEKHNLKTPKLREMIRYALAMETSRSSSTPLAQTWKPLEQHLLALGRYGSTAFLMPLYGSGELAQAFCRSAAVFGATYLLRRAAIGVETTNDEGGNIVATGVVLRPEGTLDQDETKITSYLKPTKTMCCSHVVVPHMALRQESSPQNIDSRGTSPRILRRISLVQGRVIPPEDQDSTNDQRHILIIPPSEKTHSQVIQGLVLDETTHIVPNGFTILHLTTKIENIQEESNILEAVARSLIPENSREIYHVTFSYALPSQIRSKDDEINLPSNVHVVGPSSSDDGPVLVADKAFEEARQLFAKICPGQSFLGLSETWVATLKERNLDRNEYEDDQEKYLLESALGMISKPNEKETTIHEEGGNSSGQSVALQGNMDDSNDTANIEG